MFFRFGGDELLALLFGAKPDTTPIVEGRVHQFLKSHKRFSAAIRRASYGKYRSRHL